MDVNHAAVQRAQRKVGDQLERERLARLNRRRYGPHSEAGPRGRTDRGDGASARPIR